MKFMTHFQMHLLNPQVILGVFIGSMMSFVVCCLTINAVGRQFNRQRKIGTTDFTDYQRV